MILIRQMISIILQTAHIINIISIDQLFYKIKE